MTKPNKKKSQRKKSQEMRIDAETHMFVHKGIP